MSAQYVVRELWLGEPGRRIYGKLYLPEGVTRPRLAVYAHEVGCTHKRAEQYVDLLIDHGFALFAPDFRGGGAHCRSDGDVLDMSVMTEVEDLSEVMDAVSAMPELDTARPLLLGASQGGFVAAVYAGRHPDRVGALALFYPGFVIPKAMHLDFARLEDVPESFVNRGWMSNGRRYVEDVWDYDAYGEPMRFTGPVLIVQGDADEICPWKYSARAAKLYKDATFRLIPGAGHMFSGEYLQEGLRALDEFLAKL